MICPYGLAAARVNARRWTTRIDLNACVEQGKRYLGEHACERGVVERAAAAGLSRSHFIRLFHSTTGVTPREFVASHRFAAAKRLLLDGASSAEVAERIGYEDAESFRRAFRRVVGLTPTAYFKFAQSNGDAINGAPLEYCHADQHRLSR